MEFCHDKAARNFFLGTVFSVLVCLVFSYGIHAWTGSAAKEIAVSQGAMTAAYLLEQGIDPVTAAKAVTNTTISEEGAELAQKAGLTDRMNIQYLPAAAQMKQKIGRLLAAEAVILGILFLGGSFVYLYRRERLYQKVLSQVDRFNTGDYSSHLPRLEEGTLYRLFGAVDRLANALQAQNEKEHQSREFLKDTISDISHQLKTPLAALKMYNEIISEEPEDTKAVAEFSEKTDAALQRMEQLIGMLLKITRLDAGSIVFEKESYLVSDIVDKAAEHLWTRAKKEGKQLLTEGGSAVLECDLQWTGEAFGNLIKNALDHTNPGGHIWIRWEQMPGMVRLLVEDDGTGIAAEDYHHIFKRFYRSKKSVDTQGLGLGLPLAKAIIEGQGGVISVRSAPTEGTVFTVSFLTEQ